jgi:hypothetical protein
VDVAVNAALPSVPPPVGIVKVAPAAGQAKVPAPPLLVRLVVRVSPEIEPAEPSMLTPAKDNAPEARFKATEVVPRDIELVIALSVKAKVFLVGLEFE